MYDVDKNNLWCILSKKAIGTETKKIEFLMSTNTGKVNIYSVKIQDTNCEFSFEAELNHLEKEVLLELSKNTENYKIHIFI